MKDELYIFAKQHHRLFRVADKVDIIITDRPLLLTNIYVKLYLPDNDFKTDLIRLVRSTFDTFNNCNILLDREGVNYKTEGRLQNLQESREIDVLTINELDLSRQSYSIIHTMNYEGILEHVLDRINIESYRL